MIHMRKGPISVFGASMIQKVNNSLGRVEDDHLLVQCGEIYNIACKDISNFRCTCFQDNRPYIPYCLPQSLNVSHVRSQGIR